MFNVLIKIPYEVNTNSVQACDLVYLIMFPFHKILPKKKNKLFEPLFEPGRKLLL